MNEILLDWMRHGTAMAVERERSLRVGAPPQMVAEMREEVRARNFVMANLHRAHRLFGEAQAWHWYMVEHAKLQVRRYGWAISEDEFRAACALLRAERNGRVRRSAGQPWMIDVA